MPTELDRRRLLEMELRLVRPRLISYACVIVALLAVLPMASPCILALPLVSLVNYKLATKRIAGSRRPEYPITYAASVTQLMVGVGIAMRRAAEPADGRAGDPVRQLRPGAGSIGDHGRPSPLRRLQPGSHRCEHPGAAPR